MKTAPLIIVLLIGLGILGYVFLNKQNETDNLNTNNNLSSFEEENGNQTQTTTQTPPSTPPQTTPTNPSTTETNNSQADNNQTTQVAAESVLEIELTEESIREATSNWVSTEMTGRGGRFMTPPSWTVIKINENNQVMWRVDYPQSNPEEDFVTVGNRMFSIQKYGEPTSCHGGDLENAMCVYGDDPEFTHYAKIANWF